MSDAADLDKPGCRQCRTGTGVLAFGRALPCPVQASDGLRPALPCPVTAFGRRTGFQSQCSVALSASWALPFVDELIYISGYQLKCCCMFCHKRSYSTSASRIVDHLMSCPLCPDSIKMLLMSLREGTKKKRKQKGEEEMKLVKVETELALQGVKAEKRQQTLCASIGAAENQVAGTAISRFFYSNKIQLDRVSCVPWYYIKHIMY